MLRRASAAVHRVVVDAHALPFRSESVDVVVVAFIVQHLRDPAAVFAEIHRALRPGGRVGITMWGADRDAPALGVWYEELDEIGAPPAPPIVQTDVALESADAIEAVLRAAGFGAVEVRQIPWSYRPDLDTFIERHAALGATNRRMAALSEPDRQRVLRRVRDRLSTLPTSVLHDNSEVLAAIATA
jgi:SAM-dependent methyltransferase